ncbi:MAG: hypothetical protein IJT72_06330 [Lachnospiraceae bacterium]|nr:hypothetical protein [Lachnospiraceae bacterium]
MIKTTSSENASSSNYVTVEEYEYNSNGDVIKINHYEEGQILEIREFEYSYDAYGRCESEETYITDYRYNAPESKKGIKKFTGVSFFTYDDTGNCAVENDRSAMNIISYDYDGNGNCVKKTVKNEGGVVVRIDEYDSEGFLLSETDYDLDGNVLKSITNEYTYEYYLFLLPEFIVQVIIRQYRQE